MTFIRFAALCLMACLFVLPSRDVEARAKSYPLICRGGGGMEGRFSVWDVTVNFVGAKQSAGVRTPQPGECAWLDRGFLPGEPQKFFWKAGHTMTMMVFFKKKDVTKVQASSSNFNYLSDAILNGKVFQVHAYRGQCPGRKCHLLTVTKVN